MAKVKRIPYVKYGETYEKVKEQAIKNLQNEYNEIIYAFKLPAEGEKVFNKCEITYLTLSVIDYVKGELQGRNAEDMIYDDVFFLTRKSNVYKFVKDAVEEIRKIGLFTEEFTRLNDFVDKILYNKALEYFRANYRAYKIETTEDGERLWVRTRDDSVEFDDMLDALERDKVKCELYDGDYCIVHK